VTHFEIEYLRHMKYNYSIMEPRTNFNEPATELPISDKSDNSTTPFILIVDGIIGAGKSTLIESLVTHMQRHGWRVAVIKEPAADSGELLQRYYADPSRWAYHFQTRAIHDRVAEFMKMWESHKDNTDIFISERSVMSDMLFMQTLHSQKQIDDIEWEDYIRWWSMWHRLIPMRPDLFVYLDPDIFEAMKRVKDRARNGEENIKLEYQQLLKSKHDEMFSTGYVKVTEDHVAPVYHIKTNADFKNNKSERELIVSEIEKAILCTANGTFTGGETM
jgi:deoxyadenosine/deoxycytidine kinase